MRKLEELEEDVGGYVLRAMNYDALLQRLRERLGSSPLAAFSDQILACATPSIAASCEPRLEDSSGSRVGGFPDLPPAHPWPRCDGSPLEFLGQIKLTELAGFAGAQVLPQSGTLSFFFHSAAIPSEREQSSERGRIFWFAEDSKLTRSEPPADCAPLFRVHPEKTVVWTQRCDVPDFEEMDSDEFATVPAVYRVVPPNLRLAYGEFRDAICGRYVRSKMLGAPDSVQGGEVKFDAIFRTDTSNRYRYEDYTWTNEEELRSKMRSLRLLMQATGEDGGLWGGTEVIHFWIDEASLAAHRFDRAFATAQTT